MLHRTLFPMLLFASVGAASAQCLQQRLLPTQLSDGYHLGYAVDVDGDTLMIGAGEDSSATFEAGAVYVYERQASGWSLTQQLFASDFAAEDEFGSAIDVEGDVAVISADLRDEGRIKDSGAANVFERQTDGT